MDKPYIIVDDLLPENIADNIENTMLYNVPWRFITDVTYSGVNKHTPAFAHVFINNEWEGFKSDYLHIIDPIIEAGCAAVNFKKQHLLKARSFLQAPLHDNYSSTSIDPLHTDQPFPHTVFLYYCFDAEGDTILVDKKLSMKGESIDLDPSSHPELIRVTPKKNRLLVFDGLYYHTAQQPKEGLRMIINMNLIGRFENAI